MFCNCDVLILKIISLRSIINPISAWSNKVAIDGDVNRTIPNIYNEVFCENSYRLKAVNYFLKKAPSQMFGKVLSTQLGKELFLSFSKHYKV